MTDLEQMIKQTLKIPVIELFTPILPPCVTVYPISEGAELCGNGEESERSVTYQTDIWDRDKKTVKKRAGMLKNALKESDFLMSLPSVSYMYDNNGKLWRATMTFSILEE